MKYWKLFLFHCYSCSKAQRSANVQKIGICSQCNRQLIGVQGHTHDGEEQLLCPR